MAGALGRGALPLGGGPFTLELMSQAFSLPAADPRPAWPEVEDGAVVGDEDALDGLPGGSTLVWVHQLIGLEKFFHFIADLKYRVECLGVLRLVRAVSHLKRRVETDRPEKCCRLSIV